ncbi:MAG: hypothetical protein AB1453_07910 [Chloroflexota bacterium]|jgi:hypothetical protein
MRTLIRSRYRWILLSLTLTAILVVMYINHTEGGLLAGLGQLFLTSLICLFGLLFWLLFFSQFVLPARSLNDRRRIYERLLLFIQGGHGPAIFIENGKIRQRKGEIKKDGPGVIILDSASAAVLRKDDLFNRAVGPGIVFTEHNEYLEGDKAVVDLRIQKARIGPSLYPQTQVVNYSDDQPARLEIQNRERMETRALTRDGIEIVPKIIVYFKIDAEQGEGGSEYGYNSTAIANAILRRNVDANLPPDSPDRLHDWRWLPPYLAADVWKESLSRYKLDELFHSRNNEPSALQTILQIVEQRLTQAQVEEVDAFGRSTGQFTQSQEFLLLRERGIRVLRVEIRDLQMPAEVEKQLVKNWQTSWLKQVKKESEIIETQREYIAREAREQAAQSFYLDAIRPLAVSCSQQNFSVRKIINTVLRAILATVQQNPPMQKNLAQEAERITELVEWSAGDE